MKIPKKKFFEGGGLGGRGSWGGGGLEGVRVDVNGEVNYCENSKKNFLRGGVGSGGGGSGGGGGEGPIRGWGGSKVWVRRVMWGMGDVNQE